MSLDLVLAATLLAAVSGLPALVLRSIAPRAGMRLSTGLLLFSSVLGLGGATSCLWTGSVSEWTLPGSVLGSGARMELDAMGAFFLIPVFLIAGLGMLYALGYWRGAEQRHTGGTFAIFWGLVTAGMALLIVARQSLLFLTGWEIMALTSYFLICIESRNAEARRAAWIYLIATHVGTLCLLAMFALLRIATGTFDFVAVQPGTASVGMLTVIFLLGLIGFGLKAGIFPLHFWLPAAHANAPSHISAFLSGVIIKMGIYGLVRITGLLPEPPLFWGGLLLGLGIISGILGVAFALAQHDLKRLLAYHSVENIGIILMGLGLALAGRSLGRPDLIALGLAGCVLHVWNHGLFKSLLFFGAGAVVRETHTREIDQLGGLSKQMPRTAALFLLGAAAICGLPPLNGFISELFIYLGMIRASVLPNLPHWTVAAAGVPALALIGALALACFVKVYGVVFLGLPRGKKAAHAKEAPRLLQVAMLPLAAACALIGLLPFLLVPALDRMCKTWIPNGGGWTEPAPVLPSVGTLSALGWIGLSGCILCAVLVAGWFVLRRHLARLPNASSCTWDCGFLGTTPRIQYTASSFADTIVDWFRWAMLPQKHEPELAKPFAKAGGYKSHIGDIMLDHLLLPLAHRAKDALAHLRGLQQGLTHYYLIYILAAVVLLLLWTIPLGGVLMQFFTS